MKVLMLLPTIWPNGITVGTFNIYTPDIDVKPEHVPETSTIYEFLVEYYTKQQEEDNAINLLRQGG